jgi:hypothetical protein
MAPKSPFPEFIPLTEDELQSLHCISMVNTSKVIPAAHIEKLMEGGLCPRRHLKAALERPWAASAYP